MEENWGSVPAERVDIRLEPGSYDVRVIKVAEGVSQLNRAYCSVGFVVEDNDGNPDGAQEGDERVVTSVQHPVYPVYFKGFKKAFMMAVEGLTEREFNDLPHQRQNEIHQEIFRPAKGKESSAIGAIVHIDCVATTKKDKDGAVKTHNHYAFKPAK